MVNFYVYRIKAGRKLWQDEVNAKLFEDGYTLNDDGTVSKRDNVN